jgi:phospholipid-binding lipoprotein MlaA
MGGGIVEDDVMRLLLQRFVVAVFLLEAACTNGQTTTADISAPAAALRDQAPVEDARPNDPAEGTNRKIFGFNMAVDRNVTKPVAEAYENHVPDGVRHGVHNFVTNLDEPKVFVRFLLNSTVGLAGIFDVAGSLNLPHHEADFGETFGVWGIGPGPAVQLPLLGASDVRDSVGTVLGFVANPLMQVPGGAITVISAVGAGGGVVDGRAQILDASNALEKNSVDYYAAVRSVTAQRRAALVEDGRIGAIGPKVGPAPSGS